MSVPCTKNCASCAAHSEDVGKLVAEAIAVARPRVTYKLAFIDAKTNQSVVLDGIRFTSRVLRVNLDTAQRVFAYVGTSGRELEAWADASRICWRVSGPTRSTRRCWAPP